MVWRITASDAQLAGNRAGEVGVWGQVFGLGLPQDPAENHRYAGTMPDRILLIEPDLNTRDGQLIALSELGFDAVAVLDAEQAFRAIAEAPPDIILCDAFAPGTDDLELVWQLCRRAPEATLLVTSAPSDYEAAMEVALRGAHDHISKPLRPSELRLKLRNAKERARLSGQYRLLRWEIAKVIGERPIVAASGPMIRLLENMERAAGCERTLLLVGESGTGKEVMARAIHALSSRRHHSFVAVQCAARSAESILAELFGDRSAAPNYGERTQRGLFQDAERGSLFLDEVGELPIRVQNELLRVLNEKQAESSSEPRSGTVDIRIIAATARNLRQDVSDRRFEAELFEHLDPLRLDIPALRDRREDIPLLVDHFLDHYRHELVKPIRGIAEDALERLVAHPWFGNIRELKNVIESAVMFARGERIAIQDLPPRILLAPAASDPLRDDLCLKRSRRAFEIDMIRRALRATGGNRTHAAKRLEISHRALLYKIKEYGIDA